MRRVAGGGERQRGGEAANRKNIYIYVFLWGAAAGREKIRSSWSWVKERKTGSSWEDSWKRKKSGEQNRGTGRERERSWERGG